MLKNMRLPGDVPGVQEQKIAEVRKAGSPITEALVGRLCRLPLTVAPCVVSFHNSSLIWCPRNQICRTQDSTHFQIFTQNIRAYLYGLLGNSSIGCTGRINFHIRSL